MFFSLIYFFAFPLLGQLKALLSIPLSCFLCICGSFYTFTFVMNTLIFGCSAWETCSPTLVAHSNLYSKCMSDSLFLAWGYKRNEEALISVQHCACQVSRSLYSWALKTQKTVFHLRFCLFVYWGSVGGKLLRCLYTFQSNHRLLHGKWLQKGLMVLERMQFPRLQQESIPSMTGRKTSS